MSSLKGRSKESKAEERETSERCERRGPWALWRFRRRRHTYKDKNTPEVAEKFPANFCHWYAGTSRGVFDSSCSLQGLGSGLQASLKGQDVCSCLLEGHVPTLHPRPPHPQHQVSMNIQTYLRISSPGHQHHLPSASFVFLSPDCVQVGTFAILETLWINEDQFDPLTTAQDDDPLMYTLIVFRLFLQ